MSSLLIKNEAFLWMEKFKETLALPFVEVIPPHKDYHRCNPSIVRTKEGYRTIIRMVNYSILNDHDYVPNGMNKNVQTRNFVVEWNRQFQLISSNELIDKSNRSTFPVYVCGLEDVRECVVNEKLSYLCATVADGTSDGMPQTWLFPWFTNTFTLLSALLLKPSFGDTGQKQKNWLPFMIKDDLHVIFNTCPLMIHKCNPLTGAYEVVQSDLSLGAVLSNARGSAGPIPFLKGWLYLVHEVTYTPKWIYRHRWVYLDSNFIIKSYSSLFGFRSWGIEFACGLCLAHESNYVWVTFGIRDNEAYRIKIKITDIQTTLNVI